MHILRVHGNLAVQSSESKDVRLVAAEGILRSDEVEGAGWWGVP